MYGSPGAANQISVLLVRGLAQTGSSVAKSMEHRMASVGGQTARQQVVRQRKGSGERRCGC